MVDKTKGDGVVRNTQYAVWRDDKEPEKGYSRELVHKDLDRKYWEDLSLRPRHNPKCLTFLDYFEDNVATKANLPWLGTREVTGKDDKGKNIFGDYKWLTWSKVQTNAQLLAQSMKALDFAPSTEGDGRSWNFIGIWSKNR